MNNKTINLYIIGYKGFKVLKSIPKNYFALIKNVISSNDIGVAENYYEDIKNFCHTHSIQFFARNEFLNDNSEYSIAISWKWLIKKTTGKTIVLHDSILPKYRGFNPLVSYLINAEKEIGVTAIFASEKYDEGNIIAVSKISISYPIKINDAIKKISECYIELFNQIIGSIHNNKVLGSYPQNNTESTYSLWRNESDYNINWSQSASKIKRFIDAVGHPYMGALTHSENVGIRVIDSLEVTDVSIENRTPGKVIFIEDGYPIIVCGKGLLKLISANIDGTKTSILPFKKIRTQFT